MSDKRATYGNFFITIGVILMAVCCVLVLYNAREDLAAERSAENRMTVIQQALFELIGEDADDTNGDESSLLNLPHIHNELMTVVDIEGYGYIGYLSFPTLELELPVMDQWDKARLKLAPCLYYGSLYTNDLVIAGHNYSSSFGQLKKLTIGDNVLFTDMDGVVHSYTVEDKEILNPTDVAEMVSGGWNLSLYTCNYDGSQRLTVRCIENM